MPSDSRAAEGRNGHAAGVEPQSESGGVILDPQQLQTLTVLDPDGTKGILRRTISKFADYGDEVMTQMARCLADDDMAEMSRLAHSLKSSSATLGAIDLSSRCQLIEAATRNHERPRDLDNQIEALTMAFRTARQALLDLVDH